jgi:hypothetical protein|tara:strand:+ start:205 stop:360 length:156 start_codon:yes stop_codon:yes gene_type:complete
MMKLKMSGSKNSIKKMKAFKNVRVQTGRKRGYKFDLDLHRCSKLVKQGVAS